MKRGQAALEFLMSYGWALLIVAAALYGISQSGILSSSMSLPDTCILEPGLHCEDIVVTPNSATINLVNNFGRDIRINNVSIGACSALPNENLGNSERMTVQISCAYGNSQEQVTGPLAITYTTSSSLEKIMTGEIKVTIQ